MDVRDTPQARWIERARRAGDRPAYVRILDSLAEAVRDGELQPGERLPTQRALASAVGVDLTTITRALNAGRERGLVEGVVGRGTFVRRPPEDGVAGPVDLGMTLPPPPLGLSLGAMLTETVSDLLASADVAALMSYHPGAGSPSQRAAAAAWVRPFLGEVDEARVRVSAGAQTALTALLLTLSSPGDLLVTEPLVYPGLLSAAEQAGLRVTACEADRQGVLPAALRAACGGGVRPLVALCPTLQNPTGATMGLQRRREVAEAIRRSDATLIEDDAYGRLLETPMPAVSSFVPERAHYVATVSKCMSPGLRYAVVVSPDAAAAEALTARLRTLSLMPPPLMTAVVTTWMREGVAERLVTAVRREAKARRALAAELLPDAGGGEASLHVWLEVESEAREARLLADARRLGLSLTSSRDFRVGAAGPPGVRISLGGPARRDTLATALRSIAKEVKGDSQAREVV